jgi:uncharacterized protein involved in outer membrane biogenesis
MRILLRTIEVIIVLFIAAIFVLFVVGLIMTRPDKLKPLIAKQVYNATGRQITFGGNLHWSFSPLGIEASNVKLSNPKGFSQPTMISVKQFNFHVEFWPLLKGKVHTTAIVVNGLTLNLIQTKRGKNNWEMAPLHAQHQASSPRKQKTTSKPRPPTHHESGEHESADFSIPSFKLKNATITWQDQKTGQRIAINQLNLNAKNIRANKDYHNLNDALRHITANATVTVKNLTAFKANIENLAATVSAKNGIIDAAPITAKLYQGKLQGQAQLNVTGNTPKITAKTDITNLQLKLLLNDMYRYHKLTGTAHLNAQITAHSFDKNRFLRTLNGHYKTEVRNGALQGVDLAYYGQTLASLIKREAPAKQHGGNYTDFGDLIATGPIRNGIVNVKTLSLTSPVLNVKGSGNANLLTQRLNLSLDVTLVKGSTEKQTAIAPVLPVKVSGAFDDPDFDPEYQAIVQSVAKHAIEKHLHDKISDKLKDLKLKFLSS